MCDSFNGPPRIWLSSSCLNQFIKRFFEFLCSSSCNGSDGNLGKIWIYFIPCACDSFILISLVLLKTFRTYQNFIFWHYLLIYHSQFLFFLECSISLRFLISLVLIFIEKKSQSLFYDVWIWIRMILHKRILLSVGSYYLCEVHIISPQNEEYSK